MTMSNEEMAPMDVADDLEKAQAEEQEQSNLTSNEVDEIRRLLFDRDRDRSGATDKTANTFEMDNHSTNMSVDDENPSRKEYTHLSEDTFAFLIVSPMTSFPFATGIVVVFIKTIMYSLIFADMLQKGSQKNPLGISAAIEWPVAVSQILAIAITVITQDDLITALQLIHSGYGGMSVAFEYATFWKWFCSLSVLFMVGAFGLLVTFLLIITSNDVIDLILNFTAIEFISLLDNIVFQLSSSGFFGTTNRSVTRTVKGTAYSQVRSASKVPWLQIIMLFISFLGMLSGLIVVFSLQSNGKFLPPDIIMQFDDKVRPDLATYSGLFTLKVNPDEIGQNRVAYMNEIGDGSIGYCSEIEAWTFGHSRESYCDNIIALSDHPTTTDISDALNQAWYVRIGDDSKRILPMEDVYSATACETELECGGEERGSCNAGKCVCEPEFFGLHCNYVKDEICETIRVDEQTDDFTGLRRTVAIQYNVLRDPETLELVTAYNHPIYFDFKYDHKSQTRGAAVDIIIYTGLRWMLTAVVPPKLGLHAHFPESFHASSATLGPIEATTDVVHFNTATDERSAPTSMEWFLPGSQDIADMDPVLAINTVVVCSQCGEFNPCAFENSCSDGVCQCANGETGSLCQVIPVGDGNCDSFFNRQEFGYDGGDCCEASCESGIDHQCGINPVDAKDSIQVDSVPVGFPFCQDPAYGCQYGEADCWTPKSTRIPLLIKKSSEAFVTLSSNGRTLIVSEPELDTVRVFDQVDSGWVQRGQTLEGEAKSRFGTLVAISTLPGVVARRRSGRVPVIVAVAAVGNTTNYVEVYAFEPHGTIWVTKGQPLRFKAEIDSIAIGSVGPNITLAIGLREANRAYLYKQDKNLFWQMAMNTTGSSVGLSGDGKTLVSVSTNPPPGSEGSGVWDVTNLLPNDPEIVNNLELKNLLPFGTYNFAFQSRPVVIKLSYDGEDGVTFGQMYPGTYGLSGLAMIGLKRGATSYVTNRLAEAGVDVSESLKTFYAVSPDTRFFAINSQERLIEMFNIEAEVGVFRSMKMDANSSEIATFDVDGFQNKFAISDRGSVMAVVLDDHVKVVQRSSSCNGSQVRLVVTLDEDPGSVSWSLDYIGYIKGNAYPTENIGSCRNCYDGDPRYTRVVVVEDFCVPTERAGCVQLTFSSGRERLGDGAGFIALVNGTKFASYTGIGETKAIISVEGGCQRGECSEGSHTVDVLMSFEEGGLPTKLQSPLETLWSRTSQPLPFDKSAVLVQRCVFVNNTGAYTISGSGGIGSYVVYLDEALAVSHTFDIGMSHSFDVSFGDDAGIAENVPALCSGTDCPPCALCSENMIVDPESVDIEGFTDIPCSQLSQLGENRKINADFCELYPENIESLCGCHHIDCSDDQELLRVEIEFDAHPDDIEFTIKTKEGSVVWSQSFADYEPTGNPKPAFESCVQKDGPLFFTMVDKQQDGLCCNTDSGFFLPDDARGYDVYIDGDLVGSREFPLGSQQNLVFRDGANSSPVNITQPRVWCPDCNRCATCPNGDQFKNDEFIALDLYGIVNCLDFSVNMSNYIDTDFCSQHRDHISSSCGCANHSHQCTDGESLLTFQFLMNDSLGDITVQIRDQNNVTLWTKVGFVGDNGDVQKFQACVPAFEAVFVGIYDFCDDESLCNDLVQNDGHFEIFMDNELAAKRTFSSAEIELVFGAQYTLSPVAPPDSVAPTNDLSSLPGYEVGPYAPCSICGPGSKVTIVDALVQIAYVTFTCADFEQLGITGTFPEETCAGAPSLVGSLCGCALSPATDAPVASPQTTSEPSAAPELELGPDPPCNVCGEGNEVTILDPIVVIPGQEVLPTCAEFAAGGFAGYIPIELCPLAPGLVFDLCGCTVALTTSTPVTTEAVMLAPSMGSGLEPGPDPPCNVCGEGNEVTILDPIVVIPGQEVLPTCAEFAAGGFAGYIPIELCPLAPGLIFDLCGCAPSQ